MRLLCILLLCLAALSPISAQVATIGAGDAVKVTVRSVPEKDMNMLNGVYKVDANGRLVGLPFLQGGLQAAGLTEGQLAQNMTAAYKNAGIYSNPSFTAIVDAPPQARRITVGGQVGRPGPQDYVENMTIFQAYTAAGGADRFGQKKRVFLLRPGEDKKTYNMEKDADKVVRLLPNDVVEVDNKRVWEP
ncbi:MAG: polysaccharide biosynthesis/export family protein [Verrucomicrobiales bacterium]